MRETLLQMPLKKFRWIKGLNCREWKHSISTGYCPQARGGRFDVYDPTNGPAPGSRFVEILLELVGKHPRSTFLGGPAGLTKLNCPISWAESYLKMLQNKIDRRAVIESPRRAST